MLKNVSSLILQCNIKMYVISDVENDQYSENLRGITMKRQMELFNWTKVESTSVPAHDKDIFQIISYIVKLFNLHCADISCRWCSQAADRGCMLTGEGLSPDCYFRSSGVQPFQYMLCSLSPFPLKELIQFFSSSLFFCRLSGLSLPGHMHLDSMAGLSAAKYILTAKIRRCWGQSGLRLN